MDIETIDQIRAFNRQYTELMGFLSRDYLGTGRPLSELRVLFDLGYCPPGPMRAMAHRLDLDEGYLSRIVDGFERAGWVKRTSDPSDKRKRLLTVTKAGKTEINRIIALQRADIVDRLSRRHLIPSQVAEAVGALNQSLYSLKQSDIELRNLRTGDAGWLIERHAVAYAKSDGFDATFEALVSEILASFLRDNDPARSRAWIADCGGRRLGSIFCVQGETPETAKLRLFFLEQDARGLGLGRRMLETALSFARNCGYRKMELYTHETHQRACRLYEASGFRCMSSKPKQSFGVEVVEQRWERTL